MSSEGFHSFSESLNKDGAAFTVDTEVEVKTKDGTIYKGKFPYSAFGPKTFKLIIDGTGEEKTFTPLHI